MRNMLTTSSKLIATVVNILSASMLLACSSAPTQNELQRQQVRAEQAKQQAEQRAAERAEKDAKQREKDSKIVAQREENQKNTPGPTRLDQQSANRAMQLLSTLNEIASRSKQYDDNKSGPNYDQIIKNPTPLFILDQITGRLTLQLTEYDTRVVMLRHIRAVKIFQQQSSISVLGGKPVQSSTFSVLAYPTAPDFTVVQVNGRGSDQWRGWLEVRTPDSDAANKILVTLQDLVSLFGQLDPNWRY